MTNGTMKLRDHENAAKAAAIIPISNDCFIR